MAIILNLLLAEQRVSLSLPRFCRWLAAARVRCRVLLGGGGGVGGGGARGVGHKYRHETGLASRDRDDDCYYRAREESGVGAVDRSIDPRAMRCDAATPAGGRWERARGIVAAVRRVYGDTRSRGRQQVASLHEVPVAL